MIKNYFKIAFRNLVQNRFSSTINIGGLATGMAVSMLIGLWIYDELSFNTYHKNYDRIARVMREYTWKGETSTGAHNPFPVSSQLRSSFSGDFEHVATSTFTEEHILAVGENKFNQPGNFMEKDGPEILTLEMLRGTRTGPKEISSILLSETSAKKLFGESDPINKIVKIDNREDVKVTGVYKDLPFTSEFKNVSFIAPFDLYLSFNSWLRKDDWENNSVQVLTQFSPNANLDKVSDKIKNIKPDNTKKEAAAPLITFRLHPMSKWHLYEEFKRGVNTGGRIQFVWLFGITGVFVLLLVAYHLLHRWLQNYEYPTEITWSVFAAAIGGALLITLLTVRFQAIKAAVVNPVRSLRTE